MAHTPHYLLTRRSTRMNALSWRINYLITNIGSEWWNGMNCVVLLQFLWKYKEIE